MLTAATEAEARAQLASHPHTCGDTTFSPPLTRSHDEHGLWLVFRGPCPRCAAPRELRFHARSPQRAPSPRAEVPTVSGRCAACEGQGEYTGDLATGLVTCSVCAGTGHVSATLH
jgi:hypothetical protein